MKIKYENKPMTEFGELFCGAVFMTGNIFYMKTDSVDDNETDIVVNAVNLSTGKLTYFSACTNVEILDAELTVTRSTGNMKSSI
jgi:hypothetical protein